MIALCASCWRAVDPSASRCRHCGADLAALDRRSYTDKLIGALQHPDAETVMRVAKVLGDRGDPRAMDPLRSALRRYWHEPYLAAAIVRALGRFQHVQAREAIEDALGHDSFIVRKEAAIALQHEAGASRKKAG